MLIDRSFAELLDQPASDPTERRADHRVPVETDVTIGGDARVLSGVSSDVSVHGIFVATSRPMPEGTRVSLRFRLPTGQVVATGIVRWTRDARPGVIAGMGIEFVDLCALDEAAITRFCNDRPRHFSYQDIASGSTTTH
jgi:uncharacterized protein (TIGR02266 family)